MSSASVVSSAAPRHVTGPPLGESPAGLEAAELAASAGLVLDGWQRAVLSAALTEQPNGRWDAIEVGLVVPRQNGKGAILEARELAGLFLFGEQVITHTAHRFDTCLEHFRRVRGLIESTPDLSRQVKRIRQANGDESIELLSGARLNFKARSKGSGRGFSGDCVVLDEAYYLGDLGDLLPTMSARPNPQLFYASSAPLPRAESDILRRLVARGRSGAERLLYVEYSADPDGDLASDEALAAANPALGIRLSREFIEVERAAMTVDEFERERLGVWRDLIEDDQAIPPSLWADRTGVFELVDPVTFAVDMPPDRSSCAIAAAAATTAGVDGVELVDHHRGTGWVVDRTAELAARHQNRGVVIDAMSGAGAFVGPLEARGVDVTVVSSTEHKAACGAFYDSVVDGTIAHLDDPRLEAAVAGASQRQVGDAWLWNRRGDSDIAPIVASTLAMWGHRRPVESDPELGAPGAVAL